MPGARVQLQFCMYDGVRKSEETVAYVTPWPNTGWSHKVLAEVRQLANTGQLNHYKLKNETTRYPLNN